MVKSQRGQKRSLGLITLGLIVVGAAWTGSDAAAVGAAGPGRTVRVSLSSTGAQGDAGGSTASLSANGRYVAFHSDSTDLVPGDTNAARDVFVRDRATGTTRRVSVSTTLAEGDGFSDLPAISGNGRWVAFISDATNLVQGDRNASSDVFVRDRLTGTTRRVSVSSTGAEGNANTVGLVPGISANGRRGLQLRRHEPGAR